MTQRLTERDMTVVANDLRRNARRLAALADAAEERALELGPQPTLATRQTGEEIAVTQHLATAMFDARRKREAFFESELFGEPAWDILIKLYAIDAVGRAWRPTKEVISYACASPSTAVRWLNVLVENGMVERDKTNLDERFSMLRITEHGLSTMHKYLREAAGSYARVAAELDSHAFERN